jgi:RNA polymerase sigma-70 factor (ECF subfamily)
MQQKSPARVAVSGLANTRWSFSSMDPSPTFKEAMDVLEPYRNYLLLLAESELNLHLRRKLDPADIVQQVFLRACNANPGFRSVEASATAGWLRTILKSTLIDAVRHYQRDRRDVRLERPIAMRLDDSAAGFERWLVGDHTSPSQRAERNEDLLRLADALAGLPPLMRDVVVRKHCRGQRIAEIAHEIGKTVPAASSLLRRGLEMLRASMEN